MKIAYAAQVPVPSHRAHAVHVMRMCNALSGLGHQVTLFAMPPDRPLPDVHGFYGLKQGFDVVHVPMSNLRGIAGPSFGLKIARKAQSEGCELFYSRHIYAAAAACALGLDVIYEAHQPVSNGLHRRLLQWMLRRRPHVGFVVITDALRRHYCQDFGLSTNRVIVAHDAADPPSSPPQHRSDGAFTAGYVGNLYPGKGIELVLDIARLVPEVAFEIVGGRPADLAHWHAQSPPENMTFRGQVPHGDLQRHFDGMDVLLLPLQYRVSPDGGSADIAPWTSPMKMFEYMAQGKPIIASDLPVLQEVLTDGETAMIVKADDPWAWAEAIDTFRHDTGLCTSVGQAARSLLEQNHTWRARAAAVLSAHNAEEIGSKLGEIAH